MRLEIPSLARLSIRASSWLLLPILAGALLAIARLPAEETPPVSPTPPAPADSQTEEAPGPPRLAGLRERDPVTEIDPLRALTPEERSRIEAAFQNLNASDFDTREAAAQTILGFGLRAVEVAKAFEQRPELEIREFVVHLRERTLLQYKGYLPLASRLSEDLSRPLVFPIAAGEAPQEVLERFAKSSGLRTILPRPLAAEPFRSGQELRGTAGLVLERLLKQVGLAPVFLHDQVLALAAEEAPGRAQQIHRFDREAWARNQADLDQALSAWLGLGAKVVATPSQLTVQGTAFEIARAARALALCGSPGPEPRIWPVPAHPGGWKAAYRSLETPVPSLAWSRRDPLGALRSLAAAGLPLAEPGPAHKDLLISRLQVPALDLREVPLGAALRWLRRRTAGVMSQGLEPLTLACRWEEEKGRWAFEWQQGQAPWDEANETVGGVRLPQGFPGSSGSPKQDRTAGLAWLVRRGELWPYPREAWEAMICMNRVVIRGPEPLVCGLLEQVRAYRPEEADQEPGWRRFAAEHLERQIDWDGQPASPLELLGKLRRVTGLNLLLDSNEKGASASLRLKEDDCALLPAGRYLCRRLLDELASKAGARWRMEDGCVVLGEK